MTDFSNEHAVPYPGPLPETPLDISEKTPSSKDLLAGYKAEMIQSVGLVEGETDEELYARFFKQYGESLE